MSQDAVKLELIEWLTKLNDLETINYIKVVKDSVSEGRDWWKDLSLAEKEGINRGLKDIESGRTISHEEVKAKHGL